MNHKRTAGKADQSGETEEAGSENGPIEGVSGTKEQRPTRKAALLQAAKELFGEYGYAETTFKKISERAGVALGLLTHHYGNKEKLFLACGLDVLNRFQEKLEAATEAAPDGFSAVMAFCRTYLEYSVDPTSNWLVLVRCSPYSDMKTSEERDIMTRKFLEIHRIIISALERGVADGSVLAADPHTTAMVIISVMVGANRTRGLTPYDSGNLYGETLKFIARAIAPDLSCRK